VRGEGYPAAVTTAQATTTAAATRTGWVPRVSLAAIATTAFFALVALPRTAIPLVDGDVWWHLHAGETVLDTGAVPKVDSWTLVGNGMRWISQDWLSNTVMAAVLRLGGGLGETLLSLLFAALVVAAFTLLWRAVHVRSPRTGWLGPIAWLTAGLVVAGPVLGVRVQTVDLVMTAVVVWLLWHYLAEARARWVAALPLVALVWVNTHAGFPLLFAFGGAVVVGEALDRWLGRRVDPAPLAWSRIGWLALALVVSAAVLVLNPNGTAIYEYPLATASIQAHHDFIFEWSRPDLTSFPGQVLFAFLLLVVMPTLFLARRTIRTGDALWLLGATALSLSAIRFVIVIGPIGAVIAAVYLEPWLAARVGGGRLTRTLARMARHPAGRGQRLVNALLCALVLALGVGVAAARVSPASETSAIAGAMPVAATDWLKANAPDARLFNVYAWGGWLGRELPAAKVFIDGRSDIYGDAPIRAFDQAVTLQTDPQVLLDRYGVDHVIYWPGSAFAAWLDDQPGWRRVYADGQAAIWVRVGRGP
jgi:hypothetical protein